MTAWYHQRIFPDKPGRPGGRCELSRGLLRSWTHPPRGH